MLFTDNYSQRHLFAVTILRYAIIRADNCAPTCTVKGKQDAHQLVGQAKRRTAKNRLKAVGRGFSAVFLTSVNADRK